MRFGIHKVIGSGASRLPAAVPELDSLGHTTMLASFQPDCRTVAIIMLALCAVEFYIAIFQPPFIRRFRISWGRFGGSVPVSRLGFAAWGLAFGIFGLAAILNGCGVLPSSDVPFMLVAGFLVVVAAGFYDTFIHRR